MAESDREGVDYVVCPECGSRYLLPDAAELREHWWSDDIEPVAQEWGLTCDESTCLADFTVTIDYPKAAECLVHGALDCPHREPLHYHHDGCPACDVE